MNLLRKKIENPAGVTGYVRVSVISADENEAEVIILGETRRVDISQLYIKDHDLIGIPIAHEELTPMQRAVAEGLSSGMTVKQQANVMRLAVGTMKTHYSEIRRKFRCDNHTRAALMYKLQREYEKEPPRFNRL